MSENEDSSFLEPNVVFAAQVLFPVWRQLALQQPWPGA